MPYKIFLSHATADGPLAQALHDYCQRLGSLQVYMYEHDVQPGRRLADKIEENMRAADAVLILLTPNSLASTYVQQEIGLAKGVNKLLIPLLQTGTDTTRLGILESLEWIPFDPEDSENGFDQVAAFFSRLNAQVAKREETQESIDKAVLITALAGLAGFMFYLASTSKGR